MLKGLFKKKLTIKEASGSLVSIILEECRREWEEDSKAISEYLDSEITQESFDYIPFEISIALISMELQAVRNLTPKIYTEVYEIVLDIMAVEEWKDYVVETISMEYMPHIQKAIRNNENPLEIVSSILADKIDYDLHVVSGLTLMTVIGTKLGNWKSIIEIYTVG